MAVVYGGRFFRIQIGDEDIMLASNDVIGEDPQPNVRKSFLLVNEFVTRENLSL